MPKSSPPKAPPVTPQPSPTRGNQLNAPAEPLLRRQQASQHSQIAALQAAQNQQLARLRRQTASRAAPPGAQHYPYPAHPTSWVDARLRATSVRSMQPQRAVEALQLEIWDHKSTSNILEDWRARCHSAEKELLQTHERERYYAAECHRVSNLFNTACAEVQAIRNENRNLKAQHGQQGRRAGLPKKAPPPLALAQAHALGLVPLDRPRTPVEAEQLIVGSDDGEMDVDEHSSDSGAKSAVSGKEQLVTVVEKAEDE